MVMCVRVDIAPSMYPVRVLMVCSLCYIVVPIIPTVRNWCLYMHLNSSSCLFLARHIEPEASSPQK